MSLRVQEKVLRFEISVDDVERVEIFETRDNLSGVEQGEAGTELATAPQITAKKKQ